MEAICQPRAVGSVLQRRGVGKGAGILLSWSKKRAKQDSPECLVSNIQKFLLTVLFLFFALPHSKNQRRVWFAMRK